MGWVRVTFSAVMLIVFLAVRLVVRVALGGARIRQNGPPHVVSLYRVLRLGRSAAQILQTGVCIGLFVSLAVLHSVLLSLSAAAFPPLIGPSLLQRTFFFLYSVL